MAREKIASMTLSDVEHRALNRLRTNEDGSIRSVSQVLREIVIPVLMNGDSDPIGVSPPDNETISQDDSQNVTQVMDQSKQQGWDDINLDF